MRRETQTSLTVLEGLTVKIDPAVGKRPSIEAPGLCKRCNETIFNPVTWSHLRGETLTPAVPADENADYHINDGDEYVLKLFNSVPLPSRRGPVVNIDIDAESITKSCAESCTFCDVVSLLDADDLILCRREEKVLLRLQAFWPQKNHGIVHPMLLIVGLHPGIGGGGEIVPITLIDEQAASDLTENLDLNSDPDDLSPSFDRIRAWLTNCKNTHPRCTEVASPKLPTRVLDVTLSESQGEIRLIKPIETMECQFAMLSYVWGFSGVLRLTEATEPEFMAGIKCDILPKTIRDAVTTTAGLGIQYLWIDSLCILQDSEPDKTHEIARMAEYYSNATIVISASGAKDVDTGFLHFQKSALELYNRAKYPERYGRRRLGSFQIPVHLPEASVIWLAHVAPRLYDHGREPINRRAWTLQESTVPRRLLSFLSSSGISMQCLQGESLTGEIMGDPYNEMPAYASLGSISYSGHSSQTISQLWFDLVEDYTRRSLTHQSDILVAIGALAREFCTHHHTFLLEYVAGLWTKHLREGLLWLDSPPEPKKPTNRHNYAPSWSWASSVRSVHFRNKPEMYLPSDFDGESYRRLFVPRWYCKILKCETSPLSALDPYGAVSAGFLMIQGPLRRIQPSETKRHSTTGTDDQIELENKEYDGSDEEDNGIDPVPASESAEPEPCLDTTSPWGGKPLLYSFDHVVDLDWPSGKPYYWLGIWYAGRGRARGLIVEQVNEQDDFRRLGYAEYHADMDDFPESDLHLERIIRLV